jgi:DinB superfamily
MPPVFSLEEALAILERTPRVLASLLSGLPREWTDAREREGTWSPREILAHLVHGERTDWIPRARILLAHGEGRPFDPFDRGGHDAISGDVPSLLAEFAAARAQSLADLRSLGIRDEDLGRTGRHPAFGRVTLRELLATWVVHDLGHLRQAARVMAKRYAKDVGPWIAYLPVLREIGGGSGG